MPPRLTSLLIILGVVLLAVSSIKLILDELLLLPDTPPPSPAYRPLEEVGGSVLAWIPYWDQAAAAASLKNHADQIDFIGVFWYALLEDGTIGRYPYAKVDSELIRFAQERNIKVLAVVANLPTEDEGGDWDSQRVELAISSPERRRQHVDEIMALVRVMGFDGVNIDYEALTVGQRDDFTRFITELAAALHAESKLLGVSLHPKFEENNPSYSNGSQAQDYAALAEAADQLYVMTYEQHWETSGPGPIASIEWMRPILDFARRRIPQQKLFAGLPLYGYDWPPAGKAEGLTYQEALALKQRYKAEPTWDASAREWHFSYTDDAGESREVWYQDAETIAAKRAVMKELLIPNAALWRIGSEDPAVWPHLP